MNTRASSDHSNQANSSGDALQRERSERLKALHQAPGIFIIPNPWDAGTARLFASLGFQALATTSLGFALSNGKKDTSVTLDDTLANCRAIVQATDLPVSADFENGFAREPGALASNLLKLMATGVAGGSIEDASGEPEQPIFDFALAVDRIYAAVEAVRQSELPFQLVARADGLIHGQHDLDEIIKRLQAYEKAGADILYAPGLRDLGTIRTVLEALDKPVNVNMNSTEPAVTVQALARLGVKRISVGGGFARRAMQAVCDAATEMRDQGTNQWVQQSMPGKQIDRFLR